MASEISLAQTNQIRAALGLKLIPSEPKKPETSFFAQLERQAARSQASKDADVDPQRPQEVKKSLVQDSSTSLWLERMKNFHAARPAVTRRSEVSEVSEVNQRDGEFGAEGDHAAASEQDPQVESHLDSNQESRQEPLQEQDSSAPVPLAEQDRPDLPDPPVSSEQPTNNSIDYKPATFKVRKQKTQKRRKLKHDYNLKITGKIEQEQPLLRVSSRPQTANPAVSRLVIKEQAPATDSQAVTLTSSNVFLTNIKKSQSQGETVAETSPESVQKSHNHPAPEFSEPNEEEKPAGELETAAPNLMGIGATLSQLRSRGIVSSEQEDAQRRNHRDWSREVAAKRLVRVANLEEARSSCTSSQIAAQDRIAVKEEAQIAKRAFQEYNPVVDLVYKDAKGNIVSAKQAWKDLSHTFHGTSEGKKRSEKRKQTVVNQP